MPRRGPVVLWLQQAFRLRDNPALARAAEAARERDVGLVAIHGLAPGHPLGSPRVDRFLMGCALETLRGIEERGAWARHVTATRAQPLARAICRYAKEADASLVVADDPLVYVGHEDLRVAARALADVGIPFERVEPNVVVPTALFGKAAYGAFSIRSHLQREAAPRIARRPLPAPRALPTPDAPEPPGLPPTRCRMMMHDAQAADPAPWPLALPAGEEAARSRLAAFTRGPLHAYGERGSAVAGRHHSDLSQDLHFGLLSPADVARAALRSKAPVRRKEAFLEQLIVRRELAYNAARYHTPLRGLGVLPAWARATLDKHARDRREEVYSLAQFAQARTGDEVWNATQRELRERGSIHSYMRMYWGKKILEWTRTPAQALHVMEALNGAWALDGCDPNMWVGHLWCLGLHDRPFAERPVFGKVRWMSEAGVRRKFDLPEYVAWTDAACPRL